MNDGADNDNQVEGSMSGEGEESSFGNINFHGHMPSVDFDVSFFILLYFMVTLYFV